MYSSQGRLDASDDIYNLLRRRLLDPSIWLEDGGSHSWWRIDRRHDNLSDASVARG